MFISEQSIQQVRDCSIELVVGHFIKLKKHGANATACCPFHDEKTPSFSVNEAKGIFKCFGCGESGDALQFVMKHERMDFFQAVEAIAGIAGITLEYEEVPDRKKFEAQKAEAQVLKDVLRFVIDQYKNTLWTLPEDHPVMAYLAERNISRDIIAQWQLGWAPADWNFLTTTIINKNWFAPALKLGILKRGQADDRSFDGYRSRITIPITNAHGEYIGLAGRYFEIDPADKGKKYPKYINPPENELYNKSKVLFGLSAADKAIRNAGHAFLVEGYFDVITMHANGDANTVATCGTALTEHQAQLLHRYTKNVVVFRDGDNAGQSAAVKDLFILTEAGNQVDVATLPQGEDPDSFTRKVITGQYQVEAVHKQDGVYWYTSRVVDGVANDDYKLGLAKEKVLELLAKIPNGLIRDNYFANLVKKYKWNKAALQKQLANLLDAEDDEDDGKGRLDKMPAWMDRAQIEEFGFCHVRTKKRTGYYSFGRDTYKELTNFLIKPLFHIYAGKDSRHLIQIDNGRRKAVLDIESHALINPDLLSKYVVGEGNFLVPASKNDLLPIAGVLLEQFPRCIELKFLGWQPAGFFAFVDKVYIPGQGLADLDEWGILKYSPADNESQNYLVPAASAAYKELQAIGEDPYENDRVLTYKKTDVTFAEWAAMMRRVYGDKGLVGVAYAILTLFRDVVFDIDSNCPHLYAFGEKSSGKSKWGESIAALFFLDRAAFNLNSGTDHAFFSYMSRFINCPALMNEFDEKVLKPEWFQAIKGVFDGEGRQRGVMGSKNKIEIQKVRSTLVLMGQWLCTMDDNSIVSRSLIEGFNETERTEDDKAAFNELKCLEDEGLSGILIELLQYRQYVKVNYRNQFNENLSSWRQHKKTEGRNERIMQNWCHLYSCWQLMDGKLKMPVALEYFEKYCIDRVMHWSAFIRSSDTLSEFWNTVAFLVDQGIIIPGWDFKIESRVSIHLRRNKEETFAHQFTEPTKVMLIRMNNVHKHYQQAYRTRTGKEGMTLENLQHYFSSRKYYLGACKQARFGRYVLKTRETKKDNPLNIGSGIVSAKELEEMVTSCHAFLYDELGIDIERSTDPADPAQGDPEPVQNGATPQDLPF